MSATSQDPLRVRQWEAFVSQKVAGGENHERILHAMLQANWPEVDARALIRRVVWKARRRAIAFMLGFGLFGLIALSISVTSYEQAHTVGGPYVIWWGGVLCGVVGFLYGLSKLIKTR